MFSPPDPSFEDDDEAAANSSATATTSIFLAAITFGFAVHAVLIHLFGIRRHLRKVEQEKAEAQEAHERAESERSLWERFFVPHFQHTEELPAEKLAWRWKGKARSLIWAPSVALFFIIVVRLFAGAKDFEGVPENLDFGWKYGLVPHERDVEDGDELYNEPAEKSLAFVVELNSYVHAIQGFFAALLAFPAVARGFAKPIGALPCCGRMAKNILDIAPYALTLYPTYSLIKRYIKAGEAFAGSSFGNNGLEWTGGFMAGLALGDFVTALALLHSLANDANQGSTDDEYEHEQTSNQNNDTESPPWYKFWVEDKPESKEGENGANNGTQDKGATFCVRIFQTLLGILFQLTVTATAVLYGLTWHGCLDGSPDECINDKEGDGDIPFGLLAVFVAIPVLLHTGALFRRCRKK
jgi:hypothetical protein